MLSKFIKKNFLIIGFIALLTMPVIFPNNALAGDMLGILGNVYTDSDDITPDGYDTFANIVAVVLNTAIGIGMAFGILGTTISAIKLGLSWGDPEAFARFKSGFFYSVLGFIFAIGMVTLKVVVLNTLGADTPLANDLPDF